MTKKPCMQCFVNDPVNGFRCCSDCSEPKCVGVTVNGITSWSCSDRFDDGSGALLSASNTSTDPSRCTDCHQVNREMIASERQRYYQDNKEEKQQYGRQYYQNNKEERQQYQRQYYQDNKEKNRDKVLARNREREAAESKRLEERKKNPGTKPPFRIKLLKEIIQPTVAAPSSSGNKRRKKEENNTKATFSIVGQVPKSSTLVTVEDMYDLNEQDDKEICI